MKTSTVATGRGDHGGRGRGWQTSKSGEAAGSSKEMVNSGECDFQMTVEIPLGHDDKEKSSSTVDWRAKHCEFFGHVKTADKSLSFVDSNGNVHHDDVKPGEAHEGFYGEEEHCVKGGFRMLVAHGVKSSKFHTANELRKGVLQHLRKEGLHVSFNKLNVVRTTGIGFLSEVHAVDCNRDDLAAHVTSVLSESQQLPSTFFGKDDNGILCPIVECVRTSICHAHNNKRCSTEAVEIRVQRGKHKETSEAMMATDTTPGNFIPISLKCSHETNDQKLFIGFIQRQERCNLDHAPIVLEGLTRRMVEHEMPCCDDNAQSCTVHEHFSRQGFALVETATAAETGTWKTLTTKAKRDEDEDEIDELLAHLKTNMDPVLLMSHIELRRKKPKGPQTSPTCTSCIHKLKQLQPNPQEEEPLESVPKQSSLKPTSHAAAASGNNNSQQQPATQQNQSNFNEHIAAAQLKQTMDERDQHLLQQIQLVMTPALATTAQQPQDGIDATMANNGKQRQ